MWTSTAIQFHSNGWIKNNIEFTNDDIIIELARYGVGWLRYRTSWDEPVLGLVVNIVHQGKGYGTLLMDMLHLIAKTLGYKSIRLHVDPNNTIAINLYKKMGYVKHGERENGEWVMRKVLT